MIRVSVVAALSVSALILCSVASAVVPKAGGHYKGVTSMTAINGFSDPVTFTVAANRKTVKGFTFGTFGCMGAGGFKPGVSPWTGTALKQIASMPISSSGRFSGTSLVSHSQTSPKLTDTVSYTVTGRFVKGGKATGTITVSEKLTQAAIKTPQTCGPAPMTFGASS